MSDQRLSDRVAAAEEQVHHARRDVRLLEQADQGHGGQRGQLAGLDHGRVARGQGRRELPGDLQQRVVPRRDERADTDRLVRDPAGHVRPARVNSNENINIMDIFTNTKVNIYLFFINFISIIVLIYI